MPRVLIPEHRGDTVQWRRFASLPAATTPLTEGVTPDSTTVSVTSITAQVEEYGAWIQFSEMLDLKAIDPMITQFSQLLGEQAGDTFDQLVRDAAAATTNVVYAGTATARDEITANDILDAKLIYKGLRALMNANARPINGERFIGIMHPNTYFDFRQDEHVVNALLHVYPKEEGNPLYQAYIGTFAGIDWYVSTNAKVYPGAGANGIDVYATLIFGADAIGIAGLAAYMPRQITASQFEPNTGKRIRPVEIIITPPDTPSKDDPLRQRGTIGWRSTFVAKVLNNSFLVKLEHAVSV
jgi:N4-gp56 family major capsid protein